jgi:hypothetical protein
LFSSLRDINPVSAAQGIVFSYPLETGWGCKPHVGLALLPPDRFLRMNQITINRVQQSDGSILLSANQTSVLIEKPSPDVLVLVICGAATRNIGGAMFDEIAAAFKPGKKIKLFIDLEQASSAPVAVEVWVKFLCDNLRYLSRVIVLAMTKSTSLTANVIDHFVRKDNLFDILDQPAAFQSCLAQAISQARPLP